MTTSIIAAVARDMAIGNKGQLVYHISADLKRFKALTMGHPIIMGRKTFESLPKGALPGRRNIVLTRQALSFPSAECYASLDEALKACAEDDDVFVIGGESVYREAMPIAQRLYITHIDDTPAEADAFFPTIGAEWRVEKEEAFEGYRFTDYVRA